jgi:hypothetical protein
MSKTTVKQLIDVLSQLPQDARVTCGNVFECGFSEPETVGNWSLSIIYQEKGIADKYETTESTLFQVCLITSDQGTGVIIEQ